MDFFINNILLIIFLPIWVSLIILFSVIFAQSYNRKMTTIMSVFSTLTGLIFAVFLYKYTNNSENIVLEKNFILLSGENFNICLGSLIDKISAVFLFLLMIINLISQIMSYGYLKNEKEFSRYFIFSNMLNFSYTGVILSTNLIQLFMFSSLASIFIYLLTGFYHKEKNAEIASKKLFIFNAIENFLFLCAIIFLIYFSMDFFNEQGAEILSFNNIQTIGLQLIGLIPQEFYTLICVLFLSVAFIKSAQFPFQKRLLQTNVAPLPVVLLTNTASISLSVFLFIRILPILSEKILPVITIICLISALINMIFALAEDNLKRILSFVSSTLISLAFCAISINKIPVGIMIILTFSFAQALCYQCLAKLENIYNSQNIKEMGGIREVNAALTTYFLLAIISISGTFFSGFTVYQIFLNEISKESFGLTIFVLIIMFLLTFNVFKAYFYIFEGKNKTNELIKNNEKNYLMKLLAIFILLPALKFYFAGYLTIISITISIFAILLAYISFKKYKKIYRLPDKLLSILGGKE